MKVCLWVKEIYEGTTQWLSDRCFVHVSASSHRFRALQLEAKEGYPVSTGAPSVVNTIGPTRSCALSAGKSTPRQKDDRGVHQQQEQPAGAGLLCQVSCHRLGVSMFSLCSLNVTFSFQCPGLCLLQ